MSRIFETHKVTIKKYEVTSVNRQPVNKLVDVVSGVPCRITGTNNGNIKLFILAKHYTNIPGGLHKNYQIILEDAEFVQTYLVSKEPIWAGGVKHHIETELDEAK
jgi:hypothetical protein